MIVEPVSILIMMLMGKKNRINGALIHLNSGLIKGKWFLKVQANDMMSVIIAVLVQTMSTED